MNAEGLAASAGINMGMSVVVLSLFSLLKRHPANAPVYYPLRLAAGEPLPSRRPSLLSWITSAFRLSEDDIIRRCGLDALVVIRLFKFGINLFTVCSVVGLLILVPVNYAAGEEDDEEEDIPVSNVNGRASHSRDRFTISNIKSGSNRLWVHFTCLVFISFYVLYLLHKEYKGMLNRRIQQMSNQSDRPDQFTVLVREVPFCTQHNAHGCCVDHIFSKLYPYTYQSCQIVYDGKNIVELLHLASSIERKIKKLREKLVTKHAPGSVLCNIFHSNVADLEVQEERLQEICHKVRLLQCEVISHQKELPAAFVSFKSRLGASLAAQTQQHVHPLLWITEFAPEPRDVLWNNLAIPYSWLGLRRVGVFIVASVLTVFFAIPVTAIQGIVQLEKIKKWFPPARAVQLIPGLNSVLTGYLPSLILNSFIYVIPYTMVAVTSLEGCIARSQKEMKACSMVFYFLVGNVFFLSLLSGSLLDQIGESLSHPGDFPSQLASAVSSQADFFVTYILTEGLSGFSLEILQLGILIWNCIKAHCFGKGLKEDPYLYGFPYYRVIPTVSLAILIGMVYAGIAPLLLPFLIVYFLLGYAVYVNQMRDVYKITYETNGSYWPYIHHYIIVTILLMQITMIGLFGLKSKPGASISTVLLLLLTLLFNEYCKIRFLPTFRHYPIQKAKEEDDRDVTEGRMQANCESAINAYQAPWMRPVNFGQESSSTQPLVSC